MFYIISSDDFNENCLGNDNPVLFRVVKSPYILRLIMDSNCKHLRTVDLPIKDPDVVIKKNLIKRIEFTFALAPNSDRFIFGHKIIHSLIPWKRNKTSYSYLEINKVLLKAKYPLNKPDTYRFLRSLDINIHDKMFVRWICYQSYLEVLDYLVQTGLDLSFDSNILMKEAIENENVDLIRYLRGEGLGMKMNHDLSSDLSGEVDFEPTPESNYELDLILEPE